MLFNKNWDKLPHPYPLASFIPDAPPIYSFLREERRDEPWREVLRTAARLIEIRGWVQGTSETTKGMICASHAIYVAAYMVSGGNPGLHDEACLRVCTHLGITSLPAWNDNHARTKQEVIGTLLLVADKVA
jgi:hypothetical protein